MLQPIVAQFTSRGMPAAETEARSASSLAKRRSGCSPAPTIAFGDRAPEETLPAHLPALLAASREAVAAGTPVVS